MGAPDAVRHLGVALRTLYRIIDEGEIPAYKVGRLIRLRTADLDPYLDRVRIPPGDIRKLYNPRATGPEETR